MELLSWERFVERLISKYISVVINVVLVCLGCCSKTSSTGWWFISNRHLFLTVLEAEKSKIKVSALTVSGEGLLLHDLIMPLRPCLPIPSGWELGPNILLCWEASIQNLVHVKM